MSAICLADAEGEYMATTTVEALGLVKEEVERQLRAKRANHEWLISRKRDLRKKYPDKYVAVFNGKVVAADSDLDTLFKRLRTTLKGKDLSTVAVDLIPTDDIVWIL